MSGGVNRGADRNHAGSATGMGWRLRAMRRAVLSAAEGGFYIQAKSLSPKAENGLYGRTGEKRGVSK